MATARQARILARSLRSLPEGRLVVEGVEDGVIIVASPRGTTRVRSHGRKAQVENRTRAVLYARVSTAEQEREGFSIPAQLKLLREYAALNDIDIAGEHVDVETARKTGRTQFDAMLAYLKRHTTVRAILVEKTDRLYRNLKDWVTLDELGVEIHLAKEGVVLSKESRSSEKFMHGIKVLMAKNYIDNLSEEARKGMNEKAAQGYWPSLAPLGYRNVRNDDGKKVIVVDPEMGPRVAQLFEHASTGQFSLNELAAKGRELGICYRRSGKPIGTSTLQYLLRNRLYSGSYEWNGRVYQGRHEPIVTPELWEGDRPGCRRRARNDQHTGGLQRVRLLGPHDLRPLRMRDRRRDQEAEVHLLSLHRL